MILVVENHKFQYEMEKLCRIFIPYEKIKTVYENGEFEENTVYTALNGETIKVKAVIDGKTSEKECFDEKIETEMQMARLLMKLLSEITGIVPSWGVLTGIRPSKLMMNEIARAGRDSAVEYFKKRFLVDDIKSNLAADVAILEDNIIKKASKKSFCLYISIPFCPSRCSYCSFVSHSIERTNKLIDSYVDYLCKEIKMSGEIVKQIGLTLDAVYFGGGTPTTLDEKQLEKILECVEESFDLSNLLEYTVEAGRPDTVTREKLEVLKRHSVGRVSVNPQTFNDETLKEIGRKHTVKEFYDAFFLAREYEFDSINIDLIAGLQNDSLESFCKSIESAIALSPENITVHTLCLKRSSTMVTDNEKIKNDAKTVEKMVEYADRRLLESGYKPYYMYRQSKSLGNLENVGWCKNHKECAYNILMMEEVSTIIACGAGAVTKLKEVDGDKIERIFNFKYPYEYIGRFDELAERKKQIKQFFDRC